MTGPTPGDGELDEFVSIRFGIEQGVRDVPVQAVMRLLAQHDALVAEVRKLREQRDEHAARVDRAERVALAAARWYEDDGNVDAINGLYEAVELWSPPSPGDGS